MACHDCLGRTPFASLIATMVCCIGVGLFCAALWIATDITLRGIFEGLFLFTVPWIESVQIVFIVIAVVMGCFSILLLTFGFLSTGATRQNIYAGAKCIMGGRVSAAFFMVLSYVLNIIWIAVTSVCAMPIIIYIMLNSICVYEIEGQVTGYYDNYCLNLSRFGIYRNFTEGYDRNALCEDTDLSQFCQHVKDAGPMYGLAFGGSLLIVLGMVHFLIVLAANYSQIKITKEVTEYKQAIALDESSGVY